MPEVQECVLGRTPKRGDRVKETAEEETLTCTASARDHARVRPPRGPATKGDSALGTACEGNRRVRENHRYLTESELWGDSQELASTLTYLETMLPADADPVHRDRIAQIRLRLWRTGQWLVCG